MHDATASDESAVAKGDVLGLWNQFCEELKAIGADYFADLAAPDELDEVDGIRRLSLMLEDGLRWFRECADPDFPRFGQVRDTPEIADYWYAPVLGGRRYRITGNISTILDINISVLPGTPWSQWVRRVDEKPGATTVWGDLGRDDLKVAEDGSFELIMSEQEEPGNWLRLPPEGGLVTIREYLYDWASDRPGTYEISRIGSESEAPARRDEAWLSSFLRDAASFVRTYHRHVTGSQVAPVPNTMLTPRHAEGGNSHIWYSFGSFALNDDQALVLQLDETDAKAWSIQWLTDPWYTNPDMVNRVTSLMGPDMQADADGRVRIVLSAKDTGAPNWLETTGYDRGVIVARWIWCERAPVIEPTVVDADAVARLLPSSVPAGEAQRALRTARRRAHLAIRRR